MVEGNHPWNSEDGDKFITTFNCEVAVPPNTVPGNYCNLTVPSGTGILVKVPDGHGPGSLLKLWDPGVLPVRRAWTC